MTSAVRNGEYPTTSTGLLFINDEQKRWTMRTRLSVVGATAIILGGVALSAPVSAARHVRGDFRADGFSHSGSGVPLGNGFAGPSGAGFGRLGPNHDGYDGNRYWYGDDCFPTEAGGCD